MCCTNLLFFFSNTGEGNSGLNFANLFSFVSSVFSQTFEAAILWKSHLKIYVLILLMPRDFVSICCAGLLLCFFCGFFRFSPRFQRRDGKGLISQYERSKNDGIDLLFSITGLKRCHFHLSAWVETERRQEVQELKLFGHFFFWRVGSKRYISVVNYQIPIKGNSWKKEKPLKRKKFEKNERA